MGIITKEVTITPRGKSIQHYKDLGYDVEYMKPLTIKAEDLPNGSGIKIDVLCDYCKEIICNPEYKHYYNVIKKYGGYACVNCAYIHIKETCEEKYGTTSPMQNIDVKNTYKQSLLNKYGVEHLSKLQSIIDKRRQSSIVKYGYQNPSQSPEIRAKMNESFYKNGTCRTSTQQLYLHNLYGGELNYNVRAYNLDICFPQEMICCEYNGGGHNLNVKTGKMTQEEFDQKELIRNNILKREGYKQMTIISSKDKLPSDTILLQMLSDARTYFNQYPQHSWIEFSIDNSTVRNAENKDGLPYDFGELRTISKSEVSGVSESIQTA